MTLSEEKTPLISLLKPLLWQLNSSHLKVKEADSETARAFKEALSESLSDRWVVMTVLTGFCSFAYTGTAPEGTTANFIIVGNLSKSSN
jgi:hypothetical protein